MRCIPDHPYRILVIGGSGSGKSNAFFDLIKEHDHTKFIDKIYLYAKGINASEYKLLIKKREEAAVCFDEPNSEAFIEY